MYKRKNQKGTSIEAWRWCEEIITPTTNNNQATQTVCRNPRKVLSRGHRLLSPSPLVARVSFEASAGRCCCRESPRGSRFVATSDPKGKLKGSTCFGGLRFFSEERPNRKGERALDKWLSVTQRKASCHLTRRNYGPRAQSGVVRVDSL